MRKVILLALLCFTGACAMAQQPTDPVFEHDPVLHGDSIVFPITLVNAFPFISGEVNGIKGKFMFDTGNQLAIEINDNLVPLPGKKKVGSGIVGSGQSFSVNTNDTIAEVKFANGLVYRNLIHIKSANYNFLEKITPDCIGYVGYNFFKGYIIKLDYLRRRITLYKNTEQRKSSKDFLAGEKVLGIINFETRKLPNHPIVKVKIGKADFIGSFDTGQYGVLEIEDQSKKSLIDHLIIPAGKDSQGANLLTVNKIVMDGTFKTSLSGVLSQTSKDIAAARKGIQITEPNYISFGYRFLDQYKTVWDFEGKKIYILAR